MAIAIKKIVVVVGAGASKEFNLPTGKELLFDISKLAEMHWNADRTKSSYQIDASIETAIDSIARGEAKNGHEFSLRISELKATAVRISNIALLAPSIDNLLHTHQTDRDFVQLGKVMIADCILRKEAQSSLANQSISHRRWAMFPLANSTRGSIEYVSDSWLGQLFNLLVELNDYESFLETLSRVTFICFNYDRCIEQFISSCAKLYFNLSHEKSSDLLRSINIIHPYGSLGELQVIDDCVSGYGDEDLDLLTSSKRIRTFTEGLESDQVEEQIHNIFDGAHTVFFLGFGFLELNMRILLRRGPYDVSDVFATCLGLSNESSKIISRRLCEGLLFGKKASSLRVDLLGDGRPDKVRLEDATCSQLFAKHHFVLRG
jgi:hypothetical protein